MSCEGCSLRLTFLKRKKKCEDCGFIFCSECTSSKGRLYQCYRCKILTCVPLNGIDVASLKLRDLQWFVESKGIDVPSNDRREKPVLVDWILNYSKRIPPYNNQNFKPLYPTLPPEGIGGLFGSPAASLSESVVSGSSPISNVKIGGDVKGDGNISDMNKHQIIALDSVNSRNHIMELTNMELKVLLTRNFISFRGCCEKTELQEKVCWLWDLKEAAKKKNTIPDENLCKICMEATVDSLFLDCGHMVTCTNCGKQLHDCPICRQIIIRVVRAFKS